MADASKHPDVADAKMFGIAAPTIGLPKGGGAVRGIGEKFAANPVTGGASFSVPIPTSPGRGGFGPSLSLSYDTNLGQGVFGLGWNVAIAAITRKTDRGLPSYEDAYESDIFIVAGAEDLVPALTSAEDGTSSPDAPPSRVIDGTTYDIRLYVPRIEGAFARIERWTDATNPAENFWRVISRDNVTTWYGRTIESRIADPKNPRRIFSWLACHSYDGKGNAIVYRYKSEDSQDVDESVLHEQNRSGKTRTANRHLKRILYGNHRPFLPVFSREKPWPIPPGADTPDASSDWFFEVVFDYGEHNASVPKPTDAAPWQARPDPFSSYRAAYEVRTYRLCSRILMFHHFAGEVGVGVDCLVRSTDLAYGPRDDALTDVRGTLPTRLLSVSQSRYERQREGYRKRSLPPVEFTYTQAEIDETVREVDSESLENLPYGVDGTRYQWVDLDGEGLTGILTEQGGAWWYKRNLSPLPEISDSGAPITARFGVLERLRTVPSRSGFARGQHLVDLAGDGQLDVVVFDDATAGFFERTCDEDWESFTPFQSRPNVSSSSPNARFVDLTGDGRADLLVAEDEFFTWYPSLGEAGFDAPRCVRQTLDEADGPRLVFADGTQSLYLSDFSGDGLADLVRIRNGEICYWPNLGYGCFGAQVTMDDAPWFDSPDQFDERRIRLADVDGDGVTDILYLGRDGVDVYFNGNGNRWAAAKQLTRCPRIDNLDSVTAVDLLGNGTACLVWSSPLPSESCRSMRYIDLMGGQKPDLLIRAVNNLGAETLVDYAASTKFYLADKRAGRPWITKLPFPVHVVERITVRDNWRKTEFASTYSYHHGYFDGIEREFRGFGRVEQTDIQTFAIFAAANATSPYITPDRTLYQPPVKTITWFHTGVFLDRQRVLSRFSDEYFPSWYAATHAAGASALGAFVEHELPDLDVEGNELSPMEWREAARACKGMMLRQEVYELDVDKLHELGDEVRVKLFSAIAQTSRVRLLQRAVHNRNAVFLVIAGEAATYNYELDLRSGGVTVDPRVAHTLNLCSDEKGNIQQSITVVYPRRRQHEDSALSAAELSLIRNVQSEIHVGYSEIRYTNDVPAVASEREKYRLRVPYEVRSYELTRVVPRAASGYFALSELRNYLLSSDIQRVMPADPSSPYWQVGEIAYHELPSKTLPQKRLVEHVRTLFFRDDLQGSMPLGELDGLGLTYEAYKLAFTEDLMKAVFAEKLDDVVDGSASAWDKLNEPSVSGYIRAPALTSRFSPAIPVTQLAGQYWMRSGVAGFAADAAAHFFLPEQYTDAFDATTTLNFDSKGLFIERSTDALGNTVAIESFDYRILSPRAIRDINDNRSEVVFDVLGRVVATASQGKGTQGDNLVGFSSGMIDPAPRDVVSFFTNPVMNLTTARDWLRGATARFVYHFGETRNAANEVVSWSTRPAGACAILREIHASAPGGNTSPLQIALECTDGSGELFMKKSRAEPAHAGGLPRWIIAGKTVSNNKGNPVKQFEPYFSADFGCEAIDAVGVTPLMYYDAVGRLVRCEAADGTVTRSDFSPWHVVSYDANDTVLEYGNLWFNRNSAVAASTEQQRAASAATVHADTPALMLLDSLGRDVIGVAHNRLSSARGRTGDARYLTWKQLDAEGKPLWIRDARGNVVTQYIQPPMTDGPPAVEYTGYVPCYDIAGGLLFQHNMDAGDRWALTDAARKTIVTWDVNQRQSNAGVAVTEKRVGFTKFDALRRPVEQWLTVNQSTPMLIESFVYGEGIAGAKGRNLRGTLYRHYDPSGLTQIEALDFKGNEEEVRRCLAKDYKAATIDWQSAPVSQLESESFVRIVEHDALNRACRLYDWHRGIGSRVAVHEAHYNERGALAGQVVVVGATKIASGYSTSPATTTRNAIAEITYDAKGQMKLIRYGNGTVTRCRYDALNFRLLRLRTTRPGFNPAFPSRPLPLADVRVLQDLSYTYDATGNVIAVRDDAYEPAFFQNQQVDPVQYFTYDALNRLITATARESSTAVGAPKQFDGTSAAMQFPVTAKTLRKYSERYQYDEVGNITEIRHIATGGGSWRRHYEYATTNNRLTSTWQGNNTAAAVQYDHDAHGNLLNLANVPVAQRTRWDFRDVLRALDLQGGGLAYYNYEAAKQRTRKVLTSQQGARLWERLYLGGMEIYRRYDGPDVIEEIESHHVFAGERRILLVDDVISTDNPVLGISTLDRYQYCDVQLSTCLEMDAQASLITYEEYHPYGTSAFRARRSGSEAPANRYRYTGLEKDEESGLMYRGARHYAAWLGRWVSTDPTGIVDGVNLFEYCHGRPTTEVDRTGRAGAQVGDEAAHAAQLLRGKWQISEHLVPGALLKWIGMFRNAPPETIGAKVIAEVTGMEASYYTKEAYRQTITVILEKTVAAAKTKADLGMIALVRNLARAGGLTATDVRMILDAQRSVIAESLKKEGSKVAMAEIEHLLIAQEAQAFKLLLEPLKNAAKRASIEAIGHAPKPGGRLGLLVVVGILATVTIAGSAQAEPKADGAEELHFDFESTADMKATAVTDKEKMRADVTSDYASVLVMWSLRDLYARQYAVAHKKQSTLDATMLLPMGPGVFFSTSSGNYEASPKYDEKEVEEAMTSLEAVLTKAGVTITDEERDALKAVMEETQTRARQGR